MRLLCTNDDGYMATGLHVLARAARSLGDVTIVAPDREQSAQSHALTIRNPLRTRRTSDGTHVVDGTPTDCVIIAVSAIMDGRPDAVLSGINHGSNMGEDVLYSGTVAAAMEATVIGIPALAVSYAGERYEEIEGWDDVLSALLGALLGAREFPADTLLSVNLPPVAPTEVRGIRVTSLGRRRYSDTLTRAKDPSGREFFWIGGGSTDWQGPPDSDFRAVQDGYISVTPLHLDLTNYGLIEEIRSWKLEL